MKKALFLDRDGVICKALGRYLVGWEEFELAEGIQDLICHAHEKGYVVAVVTNQPQIAKGFLTQEGLHDIHAKMREILGSKIHAIYYCPHRDEDACACRKPKPGMLLQAAQDLDIDLTKSLMVGDSNVDVNAGKTAGCKTVFVKNELNGPRLLLCSPDMVVKDVRELLTLI